MAMIGQLRESKKISAGILVGGRQRKARKPKPKQPASLLTAADRRTIAETIAHARRRGADVIFNCVFEEADYHKYAVGYRSFAQYQEYMGEFARQAGGINVIYDEAKFAAWLKVEGIDYPLDKYAFSTLRAKWTNAEGLEALRAYLKDRDSSA